jgi:DMSO/TMAO reductase YedYZ molybdopterin-dependent catalytic subunit
LQNEHRGGRLCLGVLLAFCPAWASGADVAPAPTLRVEGVLPKTGSLGQAELEKLGSTTVAWTSHGQTHQVTGVRVDKVLAHFGFTAGPMGKDVPVKDKVKGYREVLVATARDGFQAVFSCAEVTEGMGTTSAFIVWQMDGKPLGPDIGPLRLVVITDGEPARSLRQLDRLRVADVS